MTILLSDPRVAAVPVVETGEALVRCVGATGVLVRSSLAARLEAASVLLPAGLRLSVVEGHRSAAAQRLIISSYSREVRRTRPGLSRGELERLTSRFVAPLAVAPHVAGAAVDLTLVDDEGRELDLGTPIDATPEQSGGACYFDSPIIADAAREHRSILRTALAGVGLVNYPTEWWHWSYGDPYWALVTGAPHALYGPVLETAA